MTSNPVDENINTQAINYVPINNYLLPPAPITHHARERLASLRRLFQRGETEQSEPLKSKENLATVPSCLLDRLASVPDWAEFADALHDQLGDWLMDKSTAQPVILIVGPPNSGCRETLENLAERRSWQMLSRPSPDQILQGGDDWLSGLEEDDDHPWVLPVLEDTYLRHTEGLNLFRNFLDHIMAGRTGRGIIGCDSWAWAFLSRLWRGPIPTTLTLQSFDQQKLTNHLQKMAHASCARQVIFRQADNGKYVLPHHEIGVTSNEYSEFLHILAAHSRGIMGVALSIWGSCLLAEPDQSLEEKSETAELNLPHQTIWVIPWNQVESPLLPNDSGRNEAIVLHSLLLHNGSSLDLLTLVLPLSSSQTIETLYRLKERRIVALLQNIWRVTPEGYPAVRHFLQSNSYLVDQF